MARTVKAKKHCCQSRPRCQRCPVVLARLATVGLAERSGRRTFVLTRGVPKHVLRAARGR